MFAISNRVMFCINYHAANILRKNYTIKFIINLRIKFCRYQIAN
jgi:hypothetical protein